MKRKKRRELPKIAVAMAREMYEKKGTSLTRLAFIFGLSKSGFSRMAHRQRWNQSARAKRIEALIGGGSGS